MRVLYNKYHPFLSQTIALNLGISFSPVPGSDVTIAISGQNVTGIGGTYTPSQCYDGINIKVYATKDSGREPVTITITATGGESSSFDINAYISQSVLFDVNFNWTAFFSLIDGYANWRKEYPEWTLSEATTIRNGLINDLFNGQGLPTGSPFAITTSPSTANGIVLAHSNLSTSKSLAFRMNDPDGYYWENSFGYVTNIANGGTLVIDHLGHGEPGHDTLYAALMNAGYDYANCGLAYTTNNPLITQSFPTSRHNQILTQGIDRDGFDGRQLFLFDKIRFITWVLQQKAYSRIVVIGVSGGGQMAALWAAIDTRIDTTFCHRGSGAQGQPFGGSDFEQGDCTLIDQFAQTVSGPRVGSSLRTYTRFTCWALALANGRTFHNTWAVNDTCCWRHWYPHIWNYDFENSLAISMGGTFHQNCLTDTADNTHGYQSGDITYIMANL